MSLLTAFRDVASVGAALGLVGVLAPSLHKARPTARRAGALAVAVASWALLAGSIVPGHDARRAWDRLQTPLVAIAALVALVVAVLVGVVLVRLVLRRPWTWFVMLAVALPVRVPVSLGSQQPKLLVPLYVVILVGLAAWLVGRVRGCLPAEGEEGTLLDLPIAAFVAFALLSSLWSDDHTQAAVRAVFFYIPFVLLYRLVLAWWGHAPALRALGVTTVAMAVPVALFAVWQYFARDIFWNEHLEQGNVYSRFFRANGIFYDPNILGRYLVLALLAVVAAAFLRSRPRDLAVLGAVAAALAAGLVVTFSRSSALALMVALTMLAWRGFGWKRTLAVGGSIAVLLAAGAIVGSAHVRHTFSSTHRIARVSEGRWKLVKGGVEIWKSDPVVGTGLGSFEKRYARTLSERQRRRTRVVISHNAPVTVLTEQGAIGAALLLVLVVAAATSLVRASRAGGAAGWAQWTMLAMLAAILVHSLLYSALFEDPYTWVIAAAALAIGVPRRAEAEAPAALPPEPVPVG